jgi:membrane protein DedA with SNARE-associated domain
MPWPRFLFFNFSGAVIWSIAISLAGYFFGSQWERLLHIIKSVNIGILVAVALVFYLLWRRHSRSQPPGSD